MIDNFKDPKYSFLLNSYPVDVEKAPTAEHAFQIRKLDYAEFKDGEYAVLYNKMLNSSVREVRQIARNLDLDSALWDDDREDIMEEILTLKFKDPVLKQKLLATGTQELVAGGSKFWGVVDGVGANVLGKLLMGVRKKIQEEICSGLLEAKRDFLVNCGWCRQTDGDSIFGECWVPSDNQDQYYDITSAVMVQERMLGLHNNV